MDVPNKVLLFEDLTDGNESLKDVKDAIEATAEFKVSEVDDEGDRLLFFNYRWCTRATFPDMGSATSQRERRLYSLKRECRGLVFRVDAQGTAVVAARRFHKFFNVNERPDTHESLLDLRQPHRLLVKHDGSLVGPILMRDGSVKFATKSGFGSLTKLIEERFLSVEENGRRYNEWSADWLRRGYAPMFEYVSQRNRIVLEYEKDELILLAIRHNATGHYVDYETLRESAIAGGIRFTESLDGVNFGSTKEMIEQLHAKERCEGFVVQFADGAMYKVKTEWYFSRANQKEKQSFSFNSERSVWELLLKQEFDDAAPLMDTILKSQVSAFQVLLFHELGKLNERVVAFCKPHLGLTKKEFVKLVQTNVPKEQLPVPPALCYSLFDTLKEGDDTMESVVKMALKMAANTKSLEDLRAILGGIQFTERIGRGNEEENDD